MQRRTTRPIARPRCRCPPSARSSGRRAPPTAGAAARVAAETATRRRASKRRVRRTRRPVSASASACPYREAVAAQCWLRMERAGQDERQQMRLQIGCLPRVRATLDVPPPPPPQMSATCKRPRRRERLAMRSARPASFRRLWLAFGSRRNGELPGTRRTKPVNFIIAANLANVPLPRRGGLPDPTPGTSVLRHPHPAQSAGAMIRCAH